MAECKRGAVHRALLQAIHKKAWWAKKRNAKAEIEPASTETTESVVLATRPERVFWNETTYSVLSKSQSGYLRIGRISGNIETERQNNIIKSETAENDGLAICVLCFHGFFSPLVNSSGENLSWLWGWGRVFHLVVQGGEGVARRSSLQDFLFAEGRNGLFVLSAHLQASRVRMPKRPPFKFDSGRFGGWGERTSLQISAACMQVRNAVWTVCVCAPVCFIQPADDLQLIWLMVP